jgi:hypothetical protein
MRPRAASRSRSTTHPRSASRSTATASRWCS